MIVNVMRNEKDICINTQIKFGNFYDFLLAVEQYRKNSNSNIMSNNTDFHKFIE